MPKGFLFCLLPMLVLFMAQDLLLGLRRICFDDDWHVVSLLDLFSSRMLETLLGSKTYDVTNPRIE